ncbi:cysteine-type peptidase [Aureococcus anophagefferens]|nr:cysteine-type peptidase [Aureococcus anophagefferens]
MLFAVKLSLVAVFVVGDAAAFGTRELDSVRAGVRANATEHHWAVIVAGSNSFANYRHQADACHAYQIMKKNGVPEPTAAGVPGVDVYAGCVAEYTGKDVNRDVFLAVLTGDADAAGGRVLGSTAGDNVFVYYADHGAKGLVAMPANEKPVTAKDLQGALETMRSRDMYDRLVVYVEACESGSMFTGDLLANDTKVYATTAASGMESSWGCYCGTESKVDGTSLSTCLGDLYSVSWMENSDLDAPAETLAKQYRVVKRETNKSHVQLFGDQSFARDYVVAFQGDGDDKRGVAAPAAPARTGLVSSRDATLSFLEARLAARRDTAPATRNAYDAELAARAATAGRFARVSAAHGETLHGLLERGAKTDVGAFSDAHWACYGDAIEAVRTACPRGIDDEHVLGHLKVLAALCYADAGADVAGAVAAACAD